MNLLQQFRKLLPQDVIQVGTVNARDGSNYYIDIANGTGQVVVQSTAQYSPGQQVFFNQKTITGEAPGLVPFTATV